ncbi:GNAT family N-acetyltransferase [Nocardia suismassiliense]|uniref:GNAT family N-acetyltransferase n=1 Tax=Nocardia suismassiliense TaxID=2077092 RepID=UPI000D1EF2DB|nr:GNAT family protein [Nocardia suismassiliense]
MHDGWPDRLVVRPFARSDARQVADWQYAGPWQIYNFGAADDDELPSAADGYTAVADADTDRLVGFFCIGPEARVPGLDADRTMVDLGVGMDPQWVGSGHGMHFGTAVLTQLRRDYPATPIRVVVQTWNTRSRQLIRRLGFVERGEHHCMQDGRTVAYTVAVLSVDADDHHAKGPSA